MPQTDIDRKICLNMASAMFGPAGPDIARSGPDWVNRRELGIGWLLYAFVRAARPALVVEAGTGGSSFCVLEALQANEYGHLITIDPFPGCKPCTDTLPPEKCLFHEDGTPYAIEHVQILGKMDEMYPGLFTFIYDRVENVSAVWNQWVDMVVVDAWHGEEETRIVWDNWSKWVRPGGYMLFHDPIACLEAVGKVLNEKCWSGESEFSMLVEPNNLGMAVIQRKFSVDMKKFWFAGKLTSTENPQYQTTPINLYDARKMGICGEWKGSLGPTPEHLYDDMAGSFDAAEALIESGEEQSIENMERYLK